MLCISITITISMSYSFFFSFLLFMRKRQQKIRYAFVIMSNFAALPKTCKFCKWPMKKKSEKKATKIISATVTIIEKKQNWPTQEINDINNHILHCGHLLHVIVRLPLLLVVFSLASLSCCSRQMAIWVWIFSLSLSLTRAHAIFQFLLSCIHYQYVNGEWTTIYLPWIQIFLL